MKNDNIEKIFSNRRSIRRFQQKEIPYSFLKDCVNIARLSPSGKNLQPIEYIIVSDHELRTKLFSYLNWAGYLPNWEPNEFEQPMAYIIVIIKDEPSMLNAYDIGIALGHIVLYSESKNIGSCILKNIDNLKIQKLLHVPKTHYVDTVVALGYKKQQPIVETDEHNSHYWLDEDQVIHVPKKPLDSILHEQTYS